MKLQAILSQQQIVLAQGINSKKKALEQLAEILAATLHSRQPATPDGDSIAAEDILDHLFHRERLGSTGLGHGIALPHARIEHLQSPLAAFIRFAEGIEFDAIDKRPVVMAFALLVPHAATDAHLALLAQIAGLFSDERFRQQLLESETPEAIYQCFLQQDRDEA